MTHSAFVVLAAGFQKTPHNANGCPAHGVPWVKAGTRQKVRSSPISHDILRSVFGSFVRNVSSAFPCVYTLLEVRRSTSSTRPGGGIHRRKSLPPRSAFSQEDSKLDYAKICLRQRRSPEQPAAVHAKGSAGSMRNEAAPPQTRSTWACWTRVAWLKLPFPPFPRKSTPDSG